MTLHDNPALTQALLKLPYPLADYQAFATAWPHAASEIQGLHQALRPFLPDAPGPLTADNLKACERCGGAGHIEEIGGWAPDDYYPVDVDCPACDGTGTGSYSHGGNKPFPTTPDELP